ncbi:hypothetical protein ABIB77_007900, partial [Bradyrhizobium sp. i1.14.1]
MLGVVKSLDKAEEARLERGRKPCHVRSEAQHGGDAMRGVVKSLGKDEEARLERGRKPCHVRSEAQHGRDA